MIYLSRHTDDIIFMLPFLLIVIYALVVIIKDRRVQGQADDKPGGTT